MSSTNQKIAIVTGASGGIGGAAAKRLAKDGFAIAAHYAGNGGKANELVGQIESEGGRAMAVQADFANEGDVARLFAEVLDAYGRIDVVVHAGAIMSLEPIATGSIATFDKIIAANLRGSYLVMQQAAQHVAEGGRIMVFSSSVIAVAFPGYGPYIASKAGVEGLVRVLANEMRGRNVTVNAIAPGPVATELFLKGKSAEQVEKLSKLPPLERLGEVDDIAGVVSFLAGPDGRWVNGQVLRANGGFA